jgi:virulence-associated protein VagC
VRALGVGAIDARARSLRFSERQLGRLTHGGGLFHVRNARTTLAELLRARPYRSHTCTPALAARGNPVVRIGVRPTSYWLSNRFSTATNAVTLPNSVRLPSTSSTVDQVAHEERQVILRQPLPQARRQQQILLGHIGAIGLGHRPQCSTLGRLALAAKA